MNKRQKKKFDKKTRFKLYNNPKRTKKRIDNLLSDLYSPYFRDMVYSDYPELKTTIIVKIYE